MDPEQHTLPSTTKSKGPSQVKRPWGEAWRGWDASSGPGLSGGPDALRRRGAAYPSQPLLCLQVMNEWAGWARGPGGEKLLNGAVPVDSPMLLPPHQSSEKGGLLTMGGLWGTRHSWAHLAGSPVYWKHPSHLGPSAHTWCVCPPSAELYLKYKKYKRQPRFFGTRNLAARISNTLDFSSLSLETGPIYCSPV